MKKQLILAVIALAAMTFATVSCQKDDNPSNKTSNTLKQAYQPPQVDDMLAYLKDFKQKMQSRGNDDTMTLDEAAWHLSSLANYDYGDVKRDVSDFQYDTLYSHINVNNGTVSMADVNTAYSSIASAVEAFYQNTDLEDAAPRFIDVAIDGNGLVTVSLMTSYRSWWNTVYYFPTVYDMDSILGNFGIYYDTCFALYTEFPGELKRLLNLQTAYTNAYGQSDPGTGRLFYTMTRIDTLAYNANVDINGSPYLNDYMIMYFINHLPYVCYEELAYCFDRYAYLAMQSLETNEVVINWMELPLKHRTNHIVYIYQCPKIRYGQLTIIIDDPQQ